MNDINEIEKQLQGLQREIANLKKEKSTTWEEREGREYRRKYVKNKYDVIKTHLDKGQKEILQEEFKKDGYNSLSAGLRQLVNDYLKKRGY